MEIAGRTRRLTVFFLMFFGAGVCVFAHTPILYLEDNGDGTIFVQGGFSNGASAAGVPIFIKSVKTGKTLWEGVLPEVGEMNIKMPGEPYTVTFDAGPGHVVTKTGPVPEGGFKADGASAAGAAEKAGKEKEKQEASPKQQAAVVEWTPQDVVSAYPDTGVSFVQLGILILSFLNFVLLVFLAAKRKRT